jgi:ribosomal-protein-alanine N-acetyltransferase
MIELRRATLADAAAILEIERQSFDRQQERVSGRTLHTLLSSPRAASFAAVDIGSASPPVCPPLCLGWAAGFVWMRSTPPWGRVYAVAVHPQARGLGLGEQLLTTLIAALELRGARRMFLEVRCDNPAITLYQRLGFVPCADLHHYYGPQLHAHRMVRQ